MQKNSIFIEQKFRENEIEDVVESISKFPKILNEIRLVSFVHFYKFCSTKILLETLIIFHNLNSSPVQIVNYTNYTNMNGTVNGICWCPGHEG